MSNPLRSGGLRTAIEVAPKGLTVILSHPRSGKTTAARYAETRARRIIIDDPFDDQMKPDQAEGIVGGLLALADTGVRVVVLGTPTPRTRLAWELLNDRAAKVWRFTGEPFPDFRLMVGEEYARVACDLKTDAEVPA